MARNELGYLSHRQVHDDILNQLDGEDSTLNQLAREMGEESELEMLRRNLKDLRDMCLVEIDMEDPNWEIKPL